MRNLLLISLILLLSACTDNKFKVDFRFSPEVNENYTVTYYATAKKGGVTVQGVAPVMQGACEFNGITRLPTLLYITIRNSKIPLVIYAKRGQTIKVTGESADPMSWTVDGNDINKSLTVWRLANYETFEAAIPAEINKVVAMLVEEKPADPASTIALLVYFNRRVDEPLFNQLWETLSDDAKDLKWIELVGRADQPGIAVKRPSNLDAIAFKNDKGDYDTLRSDSIRAAILYFWYSNEDGRRVAKDSLVLLASQYPDSLPRFIADVCIEADSAAWNNAIRRDTLEGVARLWAPAGLADERLIDMGVSRSSMYIVFDSVGTQTYRGFNPAEALKVFRQQMDTVPSRN